MNSSKLSKVYNAEDFKKQANSTVELLSNHLSNAINGKGKAIPYKDAETEYQFWNDFEFTSAENFFENVLDRSVRTHHKKYMGHQVGATAPLSAIAGLVSSFLNNGSAVYEMGMANNAIERIVCELLSNKVGYDKNSRGFLTSGGSLGNLTALLAAKAAYLNRHPNAKRLGIMVGEQAHYSIERTARIMGLEAEGLILLPSKEDFTIDEHQVEKNYQRALEQGIEVIAFIGNAPSTATGKIDDLNFIAEFCQKHSIWYHIDAAHGGAAIFSTTYKGDLKGIEKADSIVIDGHKMMMLPAITTAVLFKNGTDSYNTFKQKADYLLTATEEEDWSNLAKRTFECTKNMMAIEWYVMIKAYSEDLFDEFVTKMYDNCRMLADKIKQHPSLELAVDPDTNILCFRYVHRAKTDQELNQINKEIRQTLLEEGDFYILQTILNEKVYIRLNTMNAFTEEADYDLVLKKIIDLADSNTLKSQ